MKKIIITSVLCVVFAMFLFAQNKKKPTQSKAAVSQASIQRGQQVYQTNCVACHQRDGGGVPRLNPPLIKTDYVLGDKTRLTQIVLKGLNETIEIEGEEYTNAMPGFPHLTDKQIADVLTYVRNSFGNKASGVTPAFVKQVRGNTK